VEAGGIEPPSENDYPQASPSAACVLKFCSQHPQAGSVNYSPPEISPKERRAGSFGKDWLAHAPIRAPVTLGRNGCLSIKQQVQVLRWHLFVVPPF